MEAEGLEKWLTEELTNGVEVNLKFPNIYNGEDGFGYEISLTARREEYTVLFMRKGYDGPFTIRKISKITWDDSEEREIRIEGLIGKQVILNPREPKRYGCESSHIAITGTLHLKEEPR